jgi:hypothetical protein
MTLVRYSKSDRGAWVRCASLALMLAVGICGLHAQGVIHVIPAQPISYGPNASSFNLDINNDGVTDYFLSCDINGAFLTPQTGNSVIVDASLSVAALMDGQTISSLVSSLDPNYRWFDGATSPGGYAIIGGQAVFDGQYTYSGNLSGKDAFLGLRLHFGSDDYFGWMEVNNFDNVAAGEILGWGYQTTPNALIMAGEIPEPSSGAVVLALGLTLFLSRNRR